jgi:glyoxylase-like metal-dependent hydrolase (beta-lactamase superfamily II)
VGRLTSVRGAGITPSNSLNHDHFMKSEFYEVTNKPWFGPRTRGRAILEHSPRYGNECTPEEFLEHLSKQYGDYFRYVEWVRFHKCLFMPKKGQPWEMRFAVCFTRPHYKTRETLHLAGQEITDHTGWYPLIMGRRTLRWRAKHSQNLLSSQASYSHIEQQSFGELVTIQNLGNNNQGTSILLEFKENSLVLDFGFQFEIDKARQRPAVGILTHTHRDHAGGLPEAIRRHKLLVLMSDSVSQQLQAMQVLNKTDFANVTLVRPPYEIKAMDGTIIKFLPGAHSPGSMMIQIITATGQEILYPGDYCVKNSYYADNPATLVGLFSSGSTRRWLLIDGTFLGHGPGGESETLSALRDDVFNAVRERRDIIFTAASPDYLYTVYGWYFTNLVTKSVGTVSRHILLDKSVLALLRSTFEPFILRQHERFDPYLRAVVGVSMSNYLETVLLMSCSYSEG